MATFKFGRYIDIHWNGYDIQGPADTVFSIPDQLYEEFDADISPVEPTLQWIDTNEFQTLQNSVPTYTIAATAPIAIGSSTATSGAVTKTWSLNASYATSTHLHSDIYQPVGTYVSSLTATSPLSGSISSAGLLSVSINTTGFQSSGTYVNAVIGSSPASVATSSGTATVSISSGTNPNGYLLTADGSGGVIFTPASTSGLTSVVGVSPISAIVSGGTVSVSLAANYQTAGTYVTSVVGTSPVSASGTTAITVSINQAALSVADASTASTVRTYVKNSSGSTITKGQVVYITGADGTNALIGLASNTSDAASSKTLGIAANTMTNNAFGYVIENGQLSNIDTSAATAGSAVWLGSTPGSYQFTVPAEPNHQVYLGVVTKANVSTGEILVKVQNGYELDELHDVFVGGVSTALPLVYNSTSSGWVAQALTSVGIADNAVVAAKIAAGAVGSAALASGSVVAASIAAGAVGSAAISAGSINSTHIGANAVVSGDIAAGAVGSAALASGAVVSAAIASGAVGSAALADNAVVSSKIAAGSVTSAIIADNAVVAAKIANAAVGAVKISSGTATSGTLLTADGSGGVSFAAAPAGGGMVLISTVSAFASASPTASLGFTNIPQTYTRLHLIGQFYVTSAGEYQIGINPSTVTNSIGGTTGFAGQIYYISKTSDNGATTYATGLNNMEGVGGGTFYCTLPSMTNRWSNVVVDIYNPQTLGPTSKLGFIAQHNAGRFVGHSWGHSEVSGPVRTLWVSGSFHIARFSLYGS